MAYDAPVADRRQFITWTAGGAFMLAVADVALAQPPGRGGAPGAAGAAAQAQSPWFTVGSDGKVTVWSTAVEMGQGSHTGQAAIIAEELDVPWAQIDVKMVDLSKYGNRISTGGSQTIRGSFARAREAGATARTQFMQAAATRWGVPIDQVTTAGGKVVNKTTRAELGYAELASAAGQLPTPVNVAYRDVADYVCIGQPQETKRLRERVTGQEIYGIDVRVPNMVRASVLQAPQFGGTLTSVDEAPAMAIPGVIKVVKINNGQGAVTAVAVIARDTFTAFKGIRALKPVWAAPAIRSSSAEISTKLAESHTAALAATPAANAAPLRAAFTGAARKVESSYELAHLAHVTMEPQNATVHVTGNKVEIWAPTQVPSQVKGGAAAWAGKQGAEVVLHTTMLGGGYGRRLGADYVELAVRIAAQHDAPVQMVWTREEDFAHDLYRRAVRQTYRAGLRADGLLDGYEIISAASDAPVGNDGATKAPYNAIQTVVHTQAPRVAAGIPSGFWRSVDPGISTFGRECFIDECAVAAGQDPSEYRLKRLGDNERAKALLTKVADTIDWKKARPAGTAVGIAVAEGFGTLTAHAVEVEVRNKAITVKRIVVASDLGTVVAPNQVRAQFEGGSLMGLGAALSEAVIFTDGKADTLNFGGANGYNVLRNRQAPKVEVFLTPNKEGVPVGGSGEPPIPSLAPALANAVFKATNQRVRNLPFTKQGYTV